VNVAHLATYPPRLAALGPVVRALAPQVDRLTVVLNEFAAVPSEAPRLPNVRYVLPPEDTKDVGKFLPDASDAEHVFFCDDDILYPPDFVARTLALRARLGPRPMIVGYHGSLYRRPSLSGLRGLDQLARFWLFPSQIARFRRIYGYGETLDRPIVVDQVATNGAMMRARDCPPYAYMRDSRKFVDVRLARWCFERGITPVVLPHEAGWLGGVAHEETIVRGFTKRNRPEVAREIRAYAFRAPGRGEAAPWAD
jgi:hypothetical protein